MEMYKLRIMNSTGAGTSDILPGDTTISDILDNPSFCGYLVGNKIALNGEYLDYDSTDCTLEDLGCDPNRTNVLSAIKPANGAC